ncbi:hypothetical protein BGZ54_006001 [Gamsiella multidivaricata]|nr:hypothetical protein BGZ54_006001 [Gamsiella multidivaricata]
MPIHNSLRLYISNDTFTLEPVYNDPSIVTENIVIQRSTGQVQLNAPAGRVPSNEEVMMIYGVLGFIRLLAGEYMIVIMDRHRVGRIGEHDIFKLKDYRIIPFSRNNLALTEAQSGQFHFSYGYELTHTVQRQSELRGNTLPVWERLSNFILPLVNGFVEIKATEINRKPFTFALISRRSRHRAGTRYFSRGVDAQGNVSNFNETEQIVIVDSTAQGTMPSILGKHVILAHVQTRGSIPIFWAQINNIKYTPRLQIFDNPQTENAFRKHFEAQKKYYGPQLAVNLINKKGYEEPMGSAFSKQIDILGDPDVKYYHFDFHHECGKMRWHRVSLLLDHLHNELVSQGYFKAEVTEGIIQQVYQRQSSVVRTNCMDCLDRTNVVQSVISRWVLNRQLQELGILAPNEKFESSEQFEFLFRNVWADNADVVSCAYSGTGALKTDFTRTGSRTKVGALHDLENSIIRYVKNNFLDGTRQDAYDLFLLYDVHDAESYPLIDNRPLHLKLMPLGVVVGPAMLIACAILPEMVYTMHFIVTNGVHYVNWPRLVPLNYDLQASQFPGIQSEPTLGTAEVELGWKNE